MWRENWQEKIELFFIYFIVIQPILDIFAYLEWPLSEITRVLAMGLAGLYLFLQLKHKSKGILVYFIVTSLFFICHFLINFYLKSPYSLSQEIIYMVKTFYFIIMLFTYVVLFQSIKENKKLQKKIIQNVSISMIVITTVMVIADITDTGKRSYDMLAKAGHTGWFFSGNELSAIMAMGLGYFIIFFIKENRRYLKAILFAMLLLVSWSMMTIGTKVSFGALILVLFTSLSWLLYHSWKKRQYNTQITWIMLVTVFVLLFTPLSAIGKNLNVTYGLSDPTTNEISENESAETPSSEVPVRVLSGRDSFLTETTNQFKEAPVLQKLFGMGRGGNYEVAPKFIEMDLLDWFFGFGIIGIALLLFPFGYAASVVIKAFKPKRIRNVAFCLILVSAGLGLGAAILAGHVLSSPAASIYLAISIALMMQLVQPRDIREVSL